MPKIKSRNSHSPDGGPSLPAHLEKFCRAVAEGSSNVEAAEIAGRSGGSASYLYRRPGVKERIAELRMLMQSATEADLQHKAERGESVVNITREDIVNGLVKEAMTANSSCARVNAWQALAKIYRLEAKTVKDLEEFDGWMDEEIKAYAETGTLPDRICELLACGKTPRVSRESGTGIQKKTRTGSDL